MSLPQLRFRLGLLAAVLATWLSCSDKPELLKPCEFGETVTCSCNFGGSRGVQQCSESGVFDDCVCDDDDNSSAPDMGAVGEVDMGPPPPPPGCMMVDPDALDFGAVSVLGTATREVEVLNCAYITPMTLDFLQTCEPGSEDPANCTPSTSFDVTTQSGIDQVTIQPLTTATLSVTYTPPDLETHEARLDVVSQNGHYESVDLVGKGDSCPQAVAEARIMGAADWRTAISTIPLSTIEFTAMSSVAPGGAVGEVEWALIQRPANSTTTLMPPDSDTPELFLDLAGNYVVELTVLDPATGESCGDPAQVMISALPDAEIHIQLVWDTPNDPDQTDGSGTDVDLHFLHPLGTWNTAPYDIYFANQSADWGMPGPDDNPSLDIDDVNGAGPENINMGAAEDGAIYQIGAYYYSDRGLGTSFTTVRVYLRGIQEFEQTDVPLNVTGDFWLVATLEAPNLTVTPVNEVIAGFPPSP